MYSRKMNLLCITQERCLLAVREHQVTELGTSG
jgi:hypothetical protein